MEQLGVIPTLKLNGENWVVWKFQTSVMLKGRGLFEIVSGVKTEPLEDAEKARWLKDDAKAQELIVTRVEQGPLTHLLSCETSKDMWSKLKSVYDKESVVSVHLLQQKFFSMEFRNEKVSTYISQLEEVRNKLKQAGEELSEKMIMTKILMSLPDRYKHFRSAWESVPADKQTLDELTSRLLIEEEREESSENATALASTSSKDTYKKGGGSKLKCYVCHKPGHYAKNCFKKSKENYKSEKIKCVYCKKIGHDIADCWFKKGKEGEKRNSSRTLETNQGSESVETNAFIGGSVTLRAEDWCMDTGASEHMCWNEALFENIAVITSNRKVKVGNGDVLDVNGVGTITLWASNGHKMIKTTLSDVLYVPKLKFNLFSVGCALDKGFQMRSDQNTCKLIDKNGKVRAIATRQNKMYKMVFVSGRNGTDSTEMNYSCISEPTIDSVERSGEMSECHAVQTLENITVWHNRLAHQNVNHVKEILSRNGINFIDCEKVVCEKCLAGKQHSMPFHSSSSRASETLELVHADVCGPMETTSIGGARYFLLLKDDFSSYRYVFFMKHKSEVKSNLEKFISLAERETNNKMKVLRTDNGLEFMNREVREILEKRGIRHQRSVIYTPQQNGRAEREMRTLVEAARSMIQGMNKTFWAEAINTATYTLNRTGTSSVTNKSPFELWYNKGYNINAFKIFGERVSVHIPKNKRLKWDSKNETGIFVGYSADVKGYRIFFPEKNKVECHRDVIFLPEREMKMPLNTETAIDQSENITNEIPEEVIQGDINRDINSDSEENENSSEYEDRDPEEDTPIYNLRRNRNRPTRLEDYELELDSAFLTIHEDGEPKTYEEAMSSNESRKWKEAIETEIKALEENETWVCVKSSGESRVIECKWVLRKKRDESGSVVQYKARLVARGFQQTGMLFTDCYSPVAKLPSVRIFLALCNNLGIPVYQLDVCSAFLNGDIKDEIYISLPKGFNEREGTICKLKKSLYGLKSSPKNWNDKFNQVMLSLSFVRSEYEYCLYIKVTKSYKLYILIYVDDLLLAGTNEKEVNYIKQVLNQSFKMKDLGQVKYFLGMEIVQDISKNQIIISQTTYLNQVLKKFNMQKCNPSKTPMEANFNHDILKKEKSESPEIEQRCRMLIGSLMYAMLCSRPDLCIVISILSRYQSCASEYLWQALKRVLRYIQGTLNLNLMFNKNENPNMIEGFADSDWAGDRTDRKSTSGYIFKVFGCTVSWSSRKQSTVALSSTEAEYIALSLAVSEACWLRYIVNDLKVTDDFVCVTVYEDNQSAIKVCKNPEFHKRLKHVDIKFHFIRDKLKKNVICLKYVSSDKQLADICTKPLNRVLFESLCKNLGLVNKIYH